MSVSSLSLYSCWRDYYGFWNPLVEPQFEALELSTCLACRLAMIPDVLHVAIPPSGKIQYNFRLVPGSLIWGFWYCPISVSQTPAVPSPSVQLTDISLGHEFFQEPVQAAFLSSEAPSAFFPSYTLISTPHPVVGDGLFSLEIWGNPGDLVAFVLGIAEVTDCPVK